MSILAHVYRSHISFAHIINALQGRAPCPSATNVDAFSIYLPFGLRTGTGPAPAKHHRMR